MSERRRSGEPTDRSGARRRPTTGPSVAVVFDGRATASRMTPARIARRSCASLADRGRAMLAAEDSARLRPMPAELDPATLASQSTSPVDESTPALSDDDVRKLVAG